MKATSSTLKIQLPCNGWRNDLFFRPQTVRFTCQDVLSSCRPQHQELAHTSLEMAVHKKGGNNRGFYCTDSALQAQKFEGSKSGKETPVRKKNLAVFVSGGGSNFKALQEAIMGEIIHGKVTVLVTDKPGCGGAEYAKNNQIPVILFPKTKSSPDGLSATDLVTMLRQYEVDFVLLAGYLKLIPTELIQAFPKSMLNIHPSLLPAFGGKGFYGSKVHRAVIASGARYSGPTIHFVDEHYDTGCILAQRVVPVLANDTAEQLASRVLVQEHQLYVEVVSALCEQRIVWREDGVPVIRSRDDPNSFY